MALSSTKPDAWTLSPQMTAAPELWRDSVVWPFLVGQHMLVNGHPVAPSTYAGFAPRLTRLGRAEFNNTDDSTTPKLKYPSGSFDRSGISDLTFVAWFIPSQSEDSGHGTASNSIAGNTSANNDGMRAFVPVTDDIIRWRLPEAAGNVDLSGTFTTYWNAGELIQYVGRLGGGSQDLDIYNATTPSRSASNSASTSASITFDEGSFWLGNTDDSNAGSFMGDILFAYIQFRRWTDEEIEHNRRDPFAMLRPAGF